MTHQPRLRRLLVAGAGVPFVGVGRRVGFEDYRRHPEILRPIPFGLRHVLDRFVFDQIDQLTGDLSQVLNGADLAVIHPAHVAAQNVAEQLGVRRVVATVFPGMIPSATTVPGGTRMRPLAGRAGRVANRLAWQSARAGTALVFDRPINQHRRRLGLPRLRAALLTLPLRADATIVMASPHVIKPPPDWPDSVKLTSFVAWDPATERPVDTATLTFLDAGDRPLLVTLGSNGAIDPGDFFDHAARVALDACQTVLVVTGPSPARHNLAGLAGVHVTDYAPFSTVMARCRAAIHHAGVGATVAAIRAGIPQVAVPRGFDQPDTAARIEALGIGVSVPWPRRHRHLAAALHRVLSEPDFHERAVTLGAKVRHEDGAAFTADVIQTHLA